MFKVSAVHNHVGTIGAETEDPCFQPWAWREGQLCGTPRTFYTQAVTIALTSLEMPKILEDYTHVFESSPINDSIWHELQEKLLSLGHRIQERNKKRARPFRTFDPRFIETAIGI